MLNTVKQTHWTEIFRTQKGAVYQSDRERCLWLEFRGQKEAYKIKDFKKLKQQIEKINLAEMASNAGLAFDLEIIYPPAQEHCWVLTLCEIVQIKALLEGAWVMLELNSILNERLYPLSV
jgi:hypothetical protein